MVLSQIGVNLVGHFTALDKIVKFPTQYIITL